MTSNEKQSERILFLVNTYMQLITAVQIRLTMEKGVAADLALSDHSVGAGQVVERLAGTGLFQRLRLMETKSSFKGIKRAASALEDSVLLSMGQIKKFSAVLWPDMEYDRIYYFNLLPEVEAVYLMSVRAGKQPQCIRFEEGLLSYESMVQKASGVRMQFMVKIHELLRRKDFRSATERYCCFYPSIFPKTDIPCQEIPLLSRENEQLIEVLNAIFDYQSSAGEIDKKYIFFGSSLDVDGCGSGETEIVLQIAELVGKENLMVKMHPRDGRDVYEKYGITVSRNSAVPWEIIQLNHDFSDHVFLSISSGSVLNASAMLGDSILTYYLYPLVKGWNREEDRMGENIDTTVAALQKTGALRKMHIAVSLDEIMEGL